MSGLLHYVEHKISWEVFVLSKVPSVGFDFEIRISLAVVTGILERNPTCFSCFQCNIICSFWKDLNTFENLRTSVTDASIFYLTGHLLLVFLSSLFFHLYCFLWTETRQIASYFSTSPNGLWATACKMTQWKKNAQRAYDTSETVMDDFQGCCCLFPFVSFLIWTVTYSFPLILFDLWRKKKEMFKKTCNTLRI